jgi:hypothetical protein
MPQRFKRCKKLFKLGLRGWPAVEKAEIADILGHKKLVMGKRYSNLSDLRKHSVVDRMNQQFLVA